MVWVGRVKVGGWCQGDGRLRGGLGLEVKYGVKTCWGCVMSLVLTGTHRTGGRVVDRVWYPMRIMYTDSP